MDTEPLRQRLIRAARTSPLDDRVPAAFERGIIARLLHRHAADPVSLWAASLWRAVMPAASVMLLTGLGVLLLGEPQTEEIVIPGDAVLLADLDPPEPTP